MRRLKAYLLQEAEQEVPGGGVVGEEATDGFVDNISVETAAGGRQRPQSTQDEARLLPRHRLLDLLHVLLDICGGAPGRARSGLSSRSQIHSSPVFSNNHSAHCANSKKCFVCWRQQLLEVVNADVCCKVLCYFKS